MHAIEVRGLRKAYGSLEAVRGVDFAIEEGEVFGLLGPNGAGKTTTVEILEGYRSRDAGEVRVLGHDPEQPGPGLPRAHRRRAPAVPALAEPDRARDARDLRRLLPHAARRRRGDRARRPRRTSATPASRRSRAARSGGSTSASRSSATPTSSSSTSRRPASTRQARRAAWEMIRSLRALGKTVLLTTHYLDEAEQLADRVAVMREGRIVRVGTPRELTTTDLETEIRYRRRTARRCCVQTSEPTRVLAELTAAAVARGEELEGLEVRRPSLEEVYLALTGRRGRGMSADAIRVGSAGRRAGSSSTSSARSSSSSGAAVRPRSSSSSSRYCSSSCSRPSTRGRSTACPRRRRCSPG